jgi:tetratricopeptide (TPR) repeat protein
MPTSRTLCCGAEEQADRALKLDPGLAEAHLAIASAAGTLHGRFNWPRMLSGVDEALKIDPALDLAFAMRARAFYHLGLFEESAAAAQRALAITPDNPAAPFEAERLLAAAALFSGRYQEARTRSEALVKKSNAPAVRMYLGMALYYLGERQQAADLLASVRRGGQPDVRSQAVLASVLAASGQAAEAQSTIDRIVSGPYMDHHVAYSLGAAFAQLGRHTDTVKWLRAAIDDGFPCYPWFTKDPLLDPVREDEGYRALARELRERFEATTEKYRAQPQR